MEEAAYALAHLDECRDLLAQLRRQLEADRDAMHLCMRGAVEEEYRRATILAEGAVLDLTTTVMRLHEQQTMRLMQMS